MILLQRKAALKVILGTAAILTYSTVSRPLLAAQPHTHDPLAHFNNRTLQVSSAREGFQLYQQGSFTIEYPDGWIIEDPGDYSSGINIFNRVPPRFGGGDFPIDLIKTTAYIESRSFNAVVRSLEQSDFETITNRVEITIGGRRALRVWTINTHSLGLYSIIELSNNQTAVVVSFYGDESWREIAQHIHWSFRKSN